MVYTVSRISLTSPAILLGRFVAMTKSTWSQSGIKTSLTSLGKFSLRYSTSCKHHQVSNQRTSNMIPGHVHEPSNGVYYHPQLTTSTVNLKIYYCIYFYKSTVFSPIAMILTHNCLSQLISKHHYLY